MSDAVGERILAAAYEQLRDHGIAALTIEGVAEAAGVAKTTVYRRYRNSADVATAAIAHFDSDADAAEEAPDLRSAIRAFLVVFATKLETVGLDVLGTMLTEPEGGEMIELHRARVIHPHRDRVAALVTAAQQRGEVRPDFDPRLALELLVGSFFARHVAGRPMAPEAWADDAVDLLWRGLAPDAGPQPG